MIIEGFLCEKLSRYQVLKTFPLRRGIRKNAGLW